MALSSTKNLSNTEIANLPSNCGGSKQKVHVLLVVSYTKVVAS
jgi:hypothetical protein